MVDARSISHLLPLAFVTTAISALGTAYIAQYGFGYEPCVLCLYQRVPYAVVAILGIAAFFLNAPAQRRMIALLGGIVFLFGSGIAVYHVGVEQHWWTSAAPCGGGTEGVTSTQDLLTALQTKPEKSCGDVDWTLFGISMATYNVAFSLVLALGAFFAWNRLKEAKDA